MHPQNNATHMFQKRSPYNITNTIIALFKLFHANTVPNPLILKLLVHIRSKLTTIHAPSPPKQKKHKKQKQETSLSIYPSIFFRSSISRPFIKGAHNSFYIISIYHIYWYWYLSKTCSHDENPWDSLRIAPQKNRWCKSFNLANHLG